MPIVGTNRVIAGLRSLSRGINFTSHINLANTQNPANVVVSTVTGAFYNEISAPAGVAVSVTPIVADRCVVMARIDYPLSAEYHGRFHAYLRGKQVGGAVGDVLVRLRVGTGTVIVGDTSSIHDGSETAFHHLYDWDVLDLGSVFLRATLGATDYFQSLNLQIWARGNTTTQVNLYDLILIPADEWIGDMSDPQATLYSNLGYRQHPTTTWRYLDANDISFPKDAYLVLRRVVNDRVQLNWQAGWVKPPCIWPAGAQRLWFLMSEYLTSSIPAEEMGRPSTTHSVQIDRVRQYHSLRGSR
jgi:hypothetical protein